MANSPSNGLEDFAGIKVYNARYVYVWGNRLDNNYFGIYLSNCVRCVVTGNLLHASGTAEQTSGNGVHAWKCDSITIAFNTARGHRDGIYFEFVTNSRIEGNHSEGNATGCILCFPTTITTKTTPSCTTAPAWRSCIPEG